MDYVIAAFRLFVALLALMGTREIWLDGDLHGLVFFTNQTALMLVVVMVWGAISQVTKVPRPPAWFKGAVVVFLVITALVSYFVLEPEAADAPAIFLGLTSGTIEHELNPLLAVVDFVLFDAHRRLRWRNAALWLGYLVAYATFTTVRAEILAEPHYPYGFVDLAALGWGGFALNIAMYGAGFYVLGLLVVAVDRALPARALLGSGGSRARTGSATAGSAGAAPGAENTTGAESAVGAEGTGSGGTTQGKPTSEGH